MHKTTPVARRLLLQIQARRLEGVSMALLSHLSVAEQQLARHLSSRTRTKDNSELEMILEQGVRSYPRLASVALRSQDTIERVANAIVWKEQGG
jgi:hypothetical protein